MYPLVNEASVFLDVFNQECSQDLYMVILTVLLYLNSAHWQESSKNVFYFTILFFSFEQYKK